MLLNLKKKPHRQDSNSSNKRESLLFPSQQNSELSFHYYRNSICVNTLYFVRYCLLLQSPMFFQSPADQLLFEPHQAKSSNNYLATRHPNPLLSVVQDKFSFQIDEANKPSIFLFPFAELRLPAVGTVEMIRVIRIIFEYERLFINNGMTLLANVLSQASGFFPVMARTAEMSETA